EPDESIALQLSDPQNATLDGPGDGTIVILANDPLTVTITASDAEAAEEDLDPGTFTVRREGPLDEDLTVAYAVGGTATPGFDYWGRGGSVVTPAGQAEASFDVVPLDDSEPEYTETIVVQLLPDPGYDVGDPDTATVNLYDNEPPVVSAEVLEADASEEGPTPGVVQFR